jgi:Sap, sulfolipid-1-addressing protein
MGQAIGGSLVMAIGIAITPLAISAALLMLTTPKARSNGPAFLVGWVFGLLAVGVIALVVMVSTSASHSGVPATWVSWLKVVLGTLLVLLALYELFVRADSGLFTARSRWTDKLEGVRPPMALGLGAVLAGARPKNILLIIAGTAVIAGTGISARDKGIAYVIFAAISTIGVAIPVVIYFVMGDRASPTLGDLQEWLARNSTAIVSVLCLVIGVDLIGVGIAALT